MGIFDFFKNDNGFKERRKYTAYSDIRKTFYSDSCVSSEETYKSGKRNGLSKYFYN